MPKKIKTQHRETDRLQEIEGMVFGMLSDDQIMQLLAERKQLLEAKREAEARRKEEAQREEAERKRQAAEQEWQKKREALVQEIAALNQSITPEKNDEELLALIAKRKTLEQQLESPVPIAETVPAAPTQEMPPAQPDVSETRTPTQTSVTEEFGREAISKDDFSVGSPFREYLDRLKDNTASMGTLLQGMPAEMKQNMAFMLKVAEIDPAYAMHYADDMVKKNTDFNIRIAAMKNPRNSGNAIAEMLPEMRTSKVILAAVKQDYRNVRFVRPDMEDYDEILRIAKQATQETVMHLKEAADITLLVPRILQQDKEFMREMTALATSSGAQTVTQAPNS